MKLRGQAGLLLTTALAAGCADRTLINTDPPGAKVTINGQAIGTTPVILTVPRWDPADTFDYRTEHDGCITETGRLGTEKNLRRVGTIFTGGVLYLFKRPHALRDSYLVTLTPSDEDSRQPGAEKKCRWCLSTGGKSGRLIVRQLIS